MYEYVCIKEERKKIKICIVFTKIFEMNFMKVYYMMLKSFISRGIFYKLFVYKEFVWIVVICMFFFFL